MAFNYSSNLEGPSLLGDSAILSGEEPHVAAQTPKLVHMYICIHIYIYVCIYIYICMLCIYINMCVYIYIYIHIN